MFESVPDKRSFAFLIILPKASSSWGGSNDENFRRKTSDVLMGISMVLEWMAT
jgi:hypothetical protein